MPAGAPAGEERATGATPEADVQMVDESPPAQASPGAAFVPQSSARDVADGDGPGDDPGDQATPADDLGATGDVLIQVTPLALVSTVLLGAGLALFALRWVGARRG